MTDIDRLWSAVCTGDKWAFGDWVGRVERPIQRSLWPFVRAVDTESVIQEAMKRMWQRSQEDGQRLEGENASLRFAIVLTRNLARNMARKQRREHLMPLGNLPDGIDDPFADPFPDPLLGRIIEKCIAMLRSPLRLALLARLQFGHVDERETAASLRMTPNTFFQNITRARRHLDECLQKNGVHEHEAFR